MKQKAKAVFQYMFVTSFFRTNNFFFIEKYDRKAGFSIIQRFEKDVIAIICINIYN